MEDILKYMDGNPWLNLLFLGLALVSIILSVFLYIRSRKEKIPLYNIRHFNLVRGHLRALDRVKISYDNEEVKDLTLTRFALWNKGKDTINNTDIAPADKFRLEISNEAKILQANIDYTQNAVNNFSVNISDDKTTLFVEFDYFHTNEGCVITLYHTGNEKEICMKGTVKGAGNIKKGVFEDNDILFQVFDMTIGKLLPEERPKRLGIFKFLLIPIALPIVFIVVPLEIFMKFKTRVPSQYKLED